MSVQGNYNKNNQAAACKSTHEPLPSYANMGLEAQQVGAETPIIPAIPKSLCSVVRRYPGERHHEPIIRGPHEERASTLKSSRNSPILRRSWVWKAAIRCFALGFVVAFGLFAEECAADPRVALVIGNGGYRSVPELDNSRNDADDISEQLKRVGFAVIDGRDLDRPAMYAALGRFAQRVRGTDAGSGLLFRARTADQRSELSGSGRFEA